MSTGNRVVLVINAGSSSLKYHLLEQENRELRRANVLKRAASFFGAELDRQHKK